MPVDHFSSLPPELLRFWLFASFAVGLCIGSFLNVCIWRIPRGESVVNPPSRCPKCGHRIRWFENIPLISWLALMGRCSQCKSPISSRYFIVELMTGLLFSMIFFKTALYGEPFSVLPSLYVMCALCLTSAFIDCELRIIPDKTTYPAMLAGLVLAFALPEAWGVHGRLHALALSATGLVVAGGLMALLALSGRFLFKREALGWGDVKFIAAAGALLGLLGPLFAVFAGSLLGSVYGIGRALLSKRRRRRPIAFGPFLAAGALLWILFGRRLLELYLEVVNPMLGR